MNNLQTVTIKSITDTTVTVAGYGVVFGGADLDGETFSADTDYMLDLVPSKPVLYDHGMNDAVQKNFIGTVTKAMPDDDGLWVEAELDRHNEYVDYVLELVKRGALGWSSGSVGHLIVRDGKSIKRWPVVEWSLTPTPAEPRTLGVEQLKALTEAIELDSAVMKVNTDADNAPVDIAEPEDAEGETVDQRTPGTVSAAVPEATNGSNIEDDATKRLRIEIELLELEVSS